MKISYNTSLIPPAPFVSIHVSNLVDNSETSIEAKIDTGADLTAIPAALVRQLNLVPAGEVQVESYDGRKSILICYDVVLRIAHVRLVGLSVITFAEDYILLGRDALNFLRLLLDGPALSLEILRTGS